MIDVLYIDKSNFNLDLACFRRSLKKNVNKFISLKNLKFCC
jgi:hypothetical protein